jgi:organic radical activating enzyme
MNKIKKHRVGFNITNHCNLNCTGCYTLSNYEFKGHSLWHDHYQYYKEWAKKISIDEFELLGGEPLLNPTVIDWFIGLSELWPDAKGCLTTNGYALNKKNKRLYDIFKNSNGKYHLEVSNHNNSTIDVIFKKIYDWINNVPVQIKPYPDTYSEIPNFNQNFIRSYENVREKDWPKISSFDEWDNLPEWIRKECIEIHQISPSAILNSSNGWKIVDENGVTIIVRNSTQFENGALIPKDDLSGFRWHKSDPKLAHDVCGNRLCSEFYNGKLHKCNTAGHFEEFQQQFNVDLDDIDINILKKYQPATSSMSIEELKVWFDNIDNPIDQCRFCPEVKNNKTILATTKKIFFQRKIN